MTSVSAMKVHATGSAKGAEMLSGAEVFRSTEEIDNGTLESDAGKAQGGIAAVAKPTESGYKEIFEMINRSEENKVTKPKDTLPQEAALLQCAAGNVSPSVSSNSVRTILTEDLFDRNSKGTTGDRFSGHSTSKVATQGVAPGHAGLLAPGLMSPASKAESEQDHGDCPDDSRDATSVEQISFVKQRYVIDKVEGGTVLFVLAPESFDQLKLEGLRTGLVGHVVGGTICFGPASVITQYLESCFKLHVGKEAKVHAEYDIATQTDQEVETHTDGGSGLGEGSGQGSEGVEADWCALGKDDVCATGGMGAGSFVAKATESVSIVEVRLYGQNSDNESELMGVGLEGAGKPEGSDTEQRGTVQEVGVSHSELGGTKLEGEGTPGSYGVGQLAGAMAQELVSKKDHISVQESPVDSFQESGDCKPKSRKGVEEKTTGSGQACDSVILGGADGGSRPTSYEPSGGPDPLGRVVGQADKVGPFGVGKATSSKVSVESTGIDLQNFNVSQ